MSNTNKEEYTRVPTSETNSNSPQCFILKLIGRSNDDSELQNLVKKCYGVFLFLCAILSLPKIIIGKI